MHSANTTALRILAPPREGCRRIDTSLFIGVVPYRNPTWFQGVGIGSGAYVAGSMRLDTACRLTTFSSRCVPGQRRIEGRPLKGGTRRIAVPSAFRLGPKSPPETA